MTSHTVPTCPNFIKATQSGTGPHRREELLRTLRELSHFLAQLRRNTRQRRLFRLREISIDAIYRLTGFCFYSTIQTANAATSESRRAHSKTITPKPIPITVTNLYFNIKKLKRCQCQRTKMDFVFILHRHGICIKRENYFRRLKCRPVGCPLQICII